MYNSGYNGGYSKAKLEWSAKKMHRPEEKGCGYYMKIIFFFCSLIQSLIIVSLVLFLVYGQPEQKIEEKRVKDLEQSNNKLNLEKISLQDKVKNLTRHLNITITAKKAADKELNTLRDLAKNSSVSISSLQNKWQLCQTETNKRAMNPICPQYHYTESRSCAYGLQKSEEMLKLVQANFTEQMTTMRMKIENANRDKLSHQLETIGLRRDKDSLQKRIENYEKSCKEDFVHSLQGIPNVTKEFLKKVDDLFMKHESFQLTCDKQSTKLEDIRANCSSLSREVENKLQAYLDKVGSQVTAILGANAKYQTENKRLSEDAMWCKGNLSATVEQKQRTLMQTQLKHDEEKEKLLLQVRYLTENGKLNENLLSVKEIDIKILNEKVNTLNMSLTTCKASQRNLGQFSTGRSNPWVLGSAGSQVNGLGSFGQSTAGLSNAGSSGTSPLGRTGSIVPGFNTAGSSGTSGIRTSAFGAGTSLSDNQFSAQISQHLRELQRYAKTD
ncbi:plasmalemma vesicle associated protein a [Tachysurus fulvidraco]|uniref:plasmalemma vesicle associated protein a n=1 Tax=Tachysurus fulvidraco TaxID=1234273 RepID=UPI001FEF3865|nr:plasmalemma vesicle associated protein a [Tachysurus fulvidraco]